jgi:parallel beta-helix repeat protein
MNRIAAVVAGLLLAFVGTSATFAGTINVPDDQPTIAAAISASVNGDVINIAAGTYHEYNLDPNGKAITIQGSPNSNTTIDAQGQYHEGGGVFVIKSGEGDDTVLKDLVITGGNTILGGGIRFSNSVSPTIQGCTILGNTSGYLGGGGLYCGSWSSPTITGCTISNNTSAGNYFGGGIYCDARSSPNIINCTISANSASNGGGVWYYNSNATITDCTISGNTASYGGGIGYSGDSNPTITDCTISGNQANYGGGIYCINTSKPTITGCTISGNTANWNAGGGGIYCTNSSSPTIIGGSVCGNSPDQTYADSSSNITSGLCWIAASCDGNPYIAIANQQEQIDQLLTMHDQQQSQIDTQQSAIEDLQKVVAACCATKTCAGDENNDGVVNIDDLLFVISVWGPCP